MEAASNVLKGSKDEPQFGSVKKLPSPLNGRQLRSCRISNHEKSIYKENSDDDESASDSHDEDFSLYSTSEESDDVDASPKTVTTRASSILQNLPLDSIPQNRTLAAGWTGKKSNSSKCNRILKTRQHQLAKAVVNAYYPVPARKQQKLDASKKRNHQNDILEPGEAHLDFSSPGNNKNTRARTKHNETGILSHENLTLPIGPAGKKSYPVKQKIELQKLYHKLAKNGVDVQCAPPACKTQNGVTSTKQNATIVFEVSTSKDHNGVPEPGEAHLDCTESFLEDLEEPSPSKTNAKSTTVIDVTHSPQKNVGFRRGKSTITKCSKKDKTLFKELAKAVVNVLPPAPSAKQKTGLPSLTAGQKKHVNMLEPGEVPLDVPLDNSAQHVHLNLKAEACEPPGNTVHECNQGAAVKSEPSDLIEPGEVTYDRKFKPGDSGATDIKNVVSEEDKAFVLAAVKREPPEENAMSADEDESQERRSDGCDVATSTPWSHGSRTSSYDVTFPAVKPEPQEETAMSVDEGEIECSSSGDISNSFPSNSVATLSTAKPYSGDEDFMVVTEIGTHIKPSTPIGDVAENCGDSLHISNTETGSVFSVNSALVQTLFWEFGHDTRSRQQRCRLCGIRNFRDIEHFCRHLLVHRSDPSFHATYSVPYADPAKWGKYPTNYNDPPWRMLIAVSTMKYYLHSCRPLETGMPYIRACTRCGEKNFSNIVQYVEHIHNHQHKKVYCLLCQQGMTNERELSQHVSHHTNNYIQCKDCFSFFENKKKLKIHKMDHRKGRLWYNCEHCSPQCFLTYQALRDHIKKRHLSDTCDKCHLVFPKAGLLMRHKCEQQSKTFQASEELVTQRSSTGNGKKQPEFSCGICPEKCETLDLLQLHKRIHVLELCCPDTYKGDLTCKKCSQTFESLDELKKHVGIHTIALKYKYHCAVCHFALHRVSAIINHLNVHVKNMVQCRQCFVFTAQTHHSRNKHRMGPPYYCEHCPDLVLPSFFHMKRHIYDNHVVDFTCEKCNKKFQKLSAYKVHSLVHKKVYKCKVCKKAFGRSDYLKKHMSVHTKFRAFKCSDCKNKFSRSDNFISHIRKMHMSDVTYRCICNEVFHHKVLYRFHKRKHRGNRPFKCDLCLTKCLKFGALKKHIIIKHLKATSHTCEVCKEQFLKQGNLIAHYDRRHKNIESVCDVCGLKFKRYRDMIDHRDRHELESLKCHECDKPFTAFSDLHRHLKNKHGENKKLSHVRVGTPPFLCDLCATFFNSFATLKHHISTHYTKEDHRCDSCGKYFESGSRLDAHREKCRRTAAVMCDKCGSYFNKPSDFMKHVCDLSFDCRMCDKSFSKKIDLSRHVKNTHSCKSEKRKRIKERS